MHGPDPAQYDAHADEVAAFLPDAPYNALYERPAMLDLMGEVAGLDVLDVGCGPGVYAEILLDLGARVSACDASPRLVDLARERVAGRADVRVHDLDLPFTWVADAGVDLVVSALVHHYLNDRPAFLAEVHRMLRPGGALVLSTGHPTADWQRLGGSYFEVAPYTETWSRGWTITAWRMPLGRMVAEFTNAGFVVERMVEPLPVRAMAESHPDTFAKLSAEPGFVMFRLLKPPVPEGRR